MRPLGILIKNEKKLLYRHSLQPVCWARRDKPHRGHYVGICEVVKRKPSTPKKRFTFNDTADSPKGIPMGLLSRISHPARPAGMTMLESKNDVLRYRF